MFYFMFFLGGRHSGLRGGRDRRIHSGGGLDILVEEKEGGEGGGV